MLFNSIEFLLFLPLVFLLYWYVFNKNLRLQNLFVIVVSYIFYGWWDWTFLVLIFFTFLCSYVSGLWIGWAEARLTRRWVCAGNIVLNLGILGVYKYYDFFVGSFVTAFHHLGIHLSAQTLGLVLPVGISFYTFQALSYTIDVYKKKLPPTKDAVSFFAYISFFLPLFTWEEWKIYENNKKSKLTLLFSKALKNMPASIHAFGGYEPKEREFDRNVDKPSGYMTDLQKSGQEVNYKYLRRIIKLADRNQIMLYFINPPAYHPENYYNQEYYYNAYQTFFSEVELLDYVDWPCPDKYRADDAHLNVSGARFFTLELRNRFCSKESLCH